MKKNPGTREVPGRCPSCGADSLISAEAQRAPAIRIPGTKKHFGIIPTELVASRAVVCTKCGHVAIFLDPAEIEAARKNAEGAK